MIAFGPAKVVVDTIKVDLQSKVDLWKNCELAKIPSYVSRLKAQLERFESNLKVLTQAAVGEEEIKILQDNIAGYTLFTTSVEDAIADLQDRVPKVEANFIPVPGANNCGTYNMSKLPTLELDTFDGNRLKFTAFWSSFIRRIDSKNIPTGDKFEYLKQSLVKEAGKCIAGLILDDKNYERAKAIVQAKYGDKSSQIDAHREALVMLETSKTTTASISDTYYRVEELLNNLEVLGDETKFEEFLPLVKSKFPAEICIRIEESLGEDERLTLAVFRTKLLRLITIREKNERSVAKVDKEVKKDNESSNWRRDSKNMRSPSYSSFSNYSSPTLNRSSVLATSLSPRNNDRTPRTPCIFCLGEHWNDDCDKVTSLEDRKKKLVGRCYICLSSRHLGRDCESTKSCYHCGVTRSHHRSLCPQYVQKLSANVALVQTEVNENEAESRHTVLAVVHSSCDTFVPAATAEVKGVGEEMFSKVKAIFDTASQSSFITQELAERLQLKIMGYLRVELIGFGSVNSSATTCGYTELELKVRGGSVFIKVIVVPHIANQHLTDWYINKVSSLKLEYPHIQINAPPRVGKFDLLVGIDYYYYVVGGRVFNVDKGMFLMETRVGFLLVGKKELEGHPVKSPTNVLSVQTNKVCVCWPERVDLSRFWELETLGLGSGLGDEQSEAIEDFYRSIKLTKNRYSISWPWKTRPPSLPDNFVLAQRRLGTVIRQLRENKEVEAYDQIFKDQLLAGVIEEVKDRNVNFEHYLPHMAVRRGDHKTTKLRVVFDASARARKTYRSLNDCLLKGRPLLEDLLLILLRFRFHPIVLLADIEKAFLQIELSENLDRDAVRFLWLKDLNGNCENNNLKIFRLKRVAFGVVSSPFLLNAVIRHHVASNLDKFPSLEDLHKFIYVDNLVISVDNVEQAVNIYNQCKNLFGLASMNMREWVTNERSLVDRFDLGDRSSEGGECENVLGINWFRSEDCLGIRVPNVGIGNVVSKRTALQFIAGVFDPFGFMAPSLLGGKLFMKKLWSLSLGWDDSLSSELLTEWKLIASDILEAVKKFKVPRCLSINEAVSKEIHCFVDASASAYQANFYIRKLFSDGTGASQLLFTKNRITPVSEGKNVKLTIPRLELLAACVGAKCLSIVREAFGENLPAFIWSDSQCVLKWISSVKVLPLFEENRIKEIRKVENLTFRFVPGHLNPADIATRKISGVDYLTETSWWHGPEFLKGGQEQWPLWNFKLTDKADDEINVTIPVSVNLKLQNPPNFNVTPPFDLDISTYSDLHTLLLDSVFNEGADEPADLDDKLLTWVKYIQEVYFSGELLNEEVRNKSKLRLGVENGLLKVKGRMVDSALTDDAQYPILLPRNCHLTNLIIKEVHEAGKHVGPPHTLALLSQRFFVPRGLAQVHRVIRNCPECRKASCGPYKLPDMPPLPKTRVNRSRPFSHIGLDGLGPFLVKDGPRLRKVWMLIITCLATRAIHLAMMEGLSAEEFLYCLREFIGRYTCPSTIICDNALGFKSVALVSRSVWWTILKSDEIQNYVHSPVCKIEWKFIPEFSPFAGGVYERMVGLVKKCVTRTVFDVTYPKNLFRVFLCEVQGVLNARPLCPLDDGEYLTPSHFLSVPILVNGPFFNPNEAGLARDSLNVMRLWQKGYKLLDKFWRLWSTRYLIYLGNRRTWRIKQNRIVSNVKPKVGEPVLLGDRLPRARWLVGKIVSLEGSSDGEIRTAIVETSDGTRYRRSVGLLYPYEAQLQDIRELTAEHNDEVDEGEEGGGEGLASPVPEGSVDGESEEEGRAARIVHRRQPVSVGDELAPALAPPGVSLARGNESERSESECEVSGVRMADSGDEAGVDELQGRKETSV